MYRTDEYDGPIIEFVLKELGEYSLVEKLNRLNLNSFVDRSSFLLCTEGLGPGMKQTILITSVSRIVVRVKGIGDVSMRSSTINRNSYHCAELRAR